jgi:hypothetical protein
MASEGRRQRAIVVNGITHHFEMHGYCGPINTNAKGDPITPLGARHPFWEAVTLWAQQGERIADGVCVWEEAPSPILRHLGGKHYEVIGYEQARQGVGA